MILSWLSRVCATILVPILFIATLGFTLSQTVFQGQYIKSELQDVNAYNKLSDGLVQEASKDSSVSGLPTETVQAQLKTIITPAVLETKVNTTIDQFVAYYNDKGPAPTLDVSDLVTQAQTAGLPVPSDPKLRQPIDIPVATKAKQVNDALQRALIIGSIITALLAITIFSIAFARRNFKPIANLIIALGISVLLAGLGMYLIPDAVDKLITKGIDSNYLVGIGSNLANDIARDLGKRLLITGAIYEVIGIGSRLILGRLTKPKAVPELFQDDIPRPRPSTAPPATPAPTPAPKPPVRKIQL